MLLYVVYCVMTSFPIRVACWWHTSLLCGHAWPVVVESGRHGLESSSTWCILAESNHPLHWWVEGQGNDRETTEAALLLFSIPYPGSSQANVANLTDMASMHAAAGDAAQVPGLTFGLNPKIWYGCDASPWTPSLALTLMVPGLRLTLPGVILAS